MTVGDKIKYLRKSMGLNQTELGERVGVKKNAVSKWECGRVEDIPTSTIKALANLFDVSPSYLIDEEKEQPTVSDGLSANKQAMYDFINTLSDEQIVRLLQIARAAFGQQTT